MNCMSVQQEKKTYQHSSQPYQQSSNTTSRAGLRSCLRGEIEDTECKRLSCFLILFIKIAGRGSIWLTVSSKRFLITREFFVTWT